MVSGIVDNHLADFASISAASEEIEDICEVRKIFLFSSPQITKFFIGGFRSARDKYEKHAWFKKICLSFSMEVSDRGISKTNDGSCKNRKKADRLFNLLVRATPYDPQSLVAAANYFSEEAQTIERAREIVEHAIVAADACGAWRIYARQAAIRIAFKFSNTPDIENIFSEIIDIVADNENLDFPDTGVERDIIEKVRGTAEGRRLVERLREIS